MSDDEDDPPRARDAADDARRKRDEASIASLAHEIVGTLPELDDEAWAARDREVAEATRRRLEVEARTTARPDLAQPRFGWPARALRFASAARATDAVAQLGAHNFADKNVVVMGGPKGVGKTVAAAVWALRRRSVTYFLRAATFAATSRYSAEDRATWMNASALVLDDLGAEYVDTKGSFLTDLDELIDVYYGAERPLIITTNCKMPALEKRYGARVFDRLIECAAFMEIGGDSMRGES